MRDVHHCSGPPVSEITYTVSSGTLNSTSTFLNEQEINNKTTFSTVCAVHGLLLPGCVQLNRCVKFLSSLWRVQQFQFLLGNSFSICTVHPL